MNCILAMKNQHLYKKEVRPSEMVILVFSSLSLDCKPTPTGAAPFRTVRVKAAGIGKKFHFIWADFVTWLNQQLLLRMATRPLSSHINIEQ